MEEILFESEERTTRADAAALLRTVADRIEAGDPLTLSAGDESHTVEVPPEFTFEVKTEREREGDESELSVEFELEWDETGDDGAGDGLSVE